MTAVSVKPMNETEARALGYDSWRSYGMAEFGYSQSQCYRLLNQAKVIEEIEAASGISPNGEITEFVARDIKPRLAEVTETIRDRVANGEEPEVVIPEVVADARSSGTTGRKWSRRAGRPDLIVAKVVRNLSTIAESIAAIDVGSYRATPEELHELDQTIGALRKFRKQLRTE